jgi:hypothetical protein
MLETKFHTPRKISGSQRVYGVNKVYLIDTLYATGRKLMRNSRKKTEKYKGGE